MQDERAIYSSGPDRTHGQVSSYMQYLPAPYQGDALLGRFLQIFEQGLAPIEQTIDSVANYFDPRLTPVEFLPWLASWLGIELDENWPVGERRDLLAQSAELLRRQGTRYALREHLRLYTGKRPLIVENFSGLRLGQDGVMGVNSRIGVLEPHTLSVTVMADHAADEQVLRGIIETQKPAHVGCTLEVHRTDQQPPQARSDVQSEPVSPVGPALRESSMSPQESV
jgi:phage tail-like protein